MRCSNCSTRVGVNKINNFHEEQIKIRAVPGRQRARLHKQKATDLTRLREVFIWLISDRRMASLHRQFLSKTGPTDVLTFQHGEIFVSIETAGRHARAFRNSLVRELRLYIAHGLLHLHGFHDRKQTDARKMERMQKRILAASTGNR